MSDYSLDPRSFESLPVKVIAPPLVVALAFAVNASPLAFFLQGFHVWMHEMGHATVAWLTGRRALPLPFGWTSIEDERSMVVYLGVLLLLGILFVASWRERTLVPMVMAVAIAALQAYMTWGLQERTQRLWQIFGGVGGQFYLSALCMAAFFFQLPEKFRWGACRYVVLFIAASCFLDIYAYWNQVHRGLEDIPWGSMINGEGDGGGDMNILRDEYRWSNHHIIGAYYRLGQGCAAALVLVYALFVFRVNRLLDPLLARVMRMGTGEG
jgi:hypothetical protein